MYVFFNEEDLHADHDLDEESGKKDREAEELRFVVHQMLACTFCVCVCVCVVCVYMLTPNISYQHLNVFSGILHTRN